MATAQFGQKTHFFFKPLSPWRPSRNWRVSEKKAALWLGGTFLTNACGALQSASRGIPIWKLNENSKKIQIQILYEAGKFGKKWLHFDGIEMFVFACYNAKIRHNLPKLFAKPSKRENSLILMKYLSGKLWWK